MSNIVFFGQADAGKSTLAGYLISRFDKRIRLSAVLNDLRRYNPTANPILTFSSVVNTNRDEVVSYRHLNSKSIHLRKIDLPFESVTIIDTPGSENYSRQRERGMYYGNVGIFFMEINNILDHKYKIDTIAPIALWSKLENKRMVFLLTKFDMAGYSKEAYLRAKIEVEGICRFFGFEDRVTIIPTAIEVDRIEKLSALELDQYDLGENICAKSKKMPWYDGKCVLDTIKDEIDELDRIDENDPLIFCITDQIDNPNSKAGKVWNIKMLSGILKKDQAICLAPVKDTNNNYRILTANVKQLRMDVSKRDNIGEVNIARTGELYGLDIKHCHIEKSHVSKDEYDVVATTCGFAAGIDFKMSAFFSFSIDSDALKFKKGKEMRLMWFGRSLPFLVLENDGKNVKGQLKNTQIAFPTKSLPKAILIKGEATGEFYNALLVQISCP